jgi:hypothetical protein
VIRRRGSIYSKLGRVTRIAALFSLTFLSVLSGCDSASVYEDCNKAEKHGSGEERCFPSTFAKEDQRAREAGGFVSVGAERVPNALVSVNGRPTTTDGGGVYRFTDTPFRYDVAARIENEVVGFHDAALRFLDLALEREGPAKGFSGTVQLTVANAPRAGHRLALFASGENVVGLSGSIADGIVVSSRTFENDKVKLHVVEYPENGGVEGAIAKGSVDLRVRAGTVTTATVSLEQIQERKPVTFQAASDVADGLSFEDIEILFDMGSPLGRVSVRRVTFGEKIELPVIADGGWIARTKATLADGGFASSGLRPFSPGDDVTLTFYAPPVAERNDLTTLWAKSAQGAGVFEHVLEPIGGGGGGATIHVFSAKADAKVPDLAPLGLPPARGEYRWTVRVFPDFAFVEAMSGATNRLYRSSSTSSARTITLP